MIFQTDIQFEKMFNNRYYLDHSGTNLIVTQKGSSPISLFYTDNEGGRKKVVGKHYVKYIRDRSYCVYKNSTKMFTFQYNDILNKLIGYVLNRNTQNYLKLFYQKKYVVVKGHVQSGKTMFMIQCACLNIALGKSTIVVLRRSLSDLSQIQDRIIQFKNNIDELYNEDFPVYYLDTTSSSKELSQALSGTQPRIIVCLGNVTQIRKIAKNKPANCSYCVFIDECDMMDTIETKSSDLLDCLKENAEIVMGVSATIMNTLAKEQIDLNNTILFDPPYNYQGIGKFIRNILPYDCKPCNRMNDDPIKKDPNLDLFLNNLSKQQPVYMPYFDQYMPLICLINIGTVLLPQQKLYNYGKKRYDQILFVLFNGNGITCFLEGKDVVLKDTHISVFLQYLKDNGGVEKYPRIAIIAGKLASRGLAFTSADYGKYLHNTQRGNCNLLGWRLTHFYFIPSQTTDQPELIQNAGRPCVTVSDYDNLQVNIYSTKKVLDDIMKSHKLQDDLIYQCLKKQNESLDSLPFQEMLNQIKIYKDKVPKKRSLTKKIKIKLNKTKKMEEDLGYSIAEYQRGHYQTCDFGDSMPSECTEEAKGEKEEKEEKEIEIGRTIDTSDYCVYISGKNISTALQTYYTLIIEAIDQNYCVWVPRSYITQYIVSEKEWKKDTVKGRLTDLVQLSKSRCKEDRKGLVVKKENGKVYMRLNE